MKTNRILSLLKRPQLSVVVVLYNMRREAARTLRSLTRAYQQNTRGLTYEVIAIDNGSSEPLDQAWVEGLGSEFRYAYFDTQTPSPCAALNYGASLARGRLLSLCIDGARILSPRVLSYSTLAAGLYENAFVYTLAMHIGQKIQQQLAEENYTREQEDELIASVDWEQDGYRLFDIASVALSSGEGYFSRLNESNCVTMPRELFEQIGGFDESFKSAAGGLANLDFFNRAHELQDVSPVMLLGEATFHQVHGGRATNVRMQDHPWNEMAAEYAGIRGKPYALSYRRPTYFGSLHSKCLHLLKPLGNILPPPPS